MVVLMMLVLRQAEVAVLEVVLTVVKGHDGRSYCDGNYNGGKICNSL